MEQIGSALITYGPLGIGCLALGWVAVKLFGKYDEAQNKRIDEGRAALDVIKANTLSQDANTAAVRALGEIIRAQKGS